MERNQPNQEPKSDARLLADKLRALAINGDFNEIGRIVKQLDVQENETIAVLAFLCSEASAAQSNLKEAVRINLSKSASIIVEVLIQRKESVALLKLGCISWHGRENSSVSDHCLQAALDLGPLDELYDDIQRWPADSSSTQLRQKKKEFGATAIIQIAERGYSGAFFCAAELLRDGDGCQADPSAARRFFYRFALGVAIESSGNLKLASEAFAELAKLTDFQDQTRHSFYSTMAEVAGAASKQLSILMPGDEFAVILDLPEAGKLEFKSSAKWDYRESVVNQELAHSVVKTVAAFMNTDGGVLVIGVGPNNELLGLEPDYKTFSEKPDQDGFRLFLGNLFCKELEKHRAQLYTVSIIKFRDKDFCRIEVKQSPELVFVKRKNQGKTEDILYVRIDNQTMPISSPLEVEAWRKQRELASKKSR